MNKDTETLALYIYMIFIGMVIVIIILIAILIDVVMITSINILLCFAGNSRPGFVAHFLFGIRSMWPEEQGEHGDDVAWALGATISHLIEILRQR